MTIHIRTKNSTGHITDWGGSSKFENPLPADETAHQLDGTPAEEKAWATTINTVKPWYCKLVGNVPTEMTQAEKDAADTDRLDPDLVEARKVKQVVRNIAENNFSGTSAQALRALARAVLILIKNL